MNQPYYDEDEMETVHIYVYEEPPKKPLREVLDHLVHRLVQVLAILMMGVFCLAPSTPVYVTKVIRVPAHFLPVQVYSVQSTLTPTGKTEHPATHAHGTISAYNGSFLNQQLPAGFILTSKDGVEVAIDQSIIVPPADASTNPPTLGSASVPAHAVVAGSQGNIPAYTINQTYGSAMYIKNLSAFQGGQDAYTEQVITPDDTAKALESARSELTVKIPIGLLTGPCAEVTSQSGRTLTVSWSCQYVTYTVPRNVQVLSAHVQGKDVILQVSVLVLPH